MKLFCLTHEVLHNHMHHFLTGRYSLLLQLIANSCNACSSCRTIYTQYSVLRLNHEDADNKEVAAMLTI